MSNISATGKFISRSEKLHGVGKYDYSQCTYIRSKAKIILRCIEHDHVFVVTPDNHIHRGSGCTKCTGKHIKDVEVFITHAREVHGLEKYDYSRCVYTGALKKVKLRCVEHDHWFSVTPSAHISHRSGCPKCAGVYIPTTEEFIAKSKELHGHEKYDYSWCTYTGAPQKVKLRCVEHDHWFDISPKNHVVGCGGCPKCAGVYIPTTEEFIAKSKELHGHGKYDYTKCIYDGAQQKVKLRCIEHDHWFGISASSHILQKRGCIKCTGAGFSKKQIDYLGYVSNRVGCSIHHSANVGEFKIQGIGKVDGYCEETNTVYEFHGDYWHGHPSKFSATDVHPITKKTYGELYQKTLARDQKIKDAGYNLVVIWEHEWDGMLTNIIQPL